MAYELYKKDMYGNPVPYMVTNNEPTATRLMKAVEGLTSRYVPKHVQTNIKL